MQGRHFQFVLGDCAGLVATQHIHARRLLDRGESRHEHALFGQLQGTERGSHGKGGRQCHRDRGHQEYEGERQDFTQGNRCNQSVDQDHYYQGGVQNDQGSYDLEYDLLKVTSRLRQADQFRGLSERGSRACGGDFAGRLAPFDLRSRVGHLPTTGFDRHGLPCQRRLIDQNLPRLNAEVCWDQISHPQMNHISRHQVSGGAELPVTVTQHTGLDRQPFAQERQGTLRATFLNKAQDCVHDEEYANDPRLGIMPQQQFQDDRYFEHPRDWCPEFSKQREEGMPALLPVPCWGRSASAVPPLRPSSALGRAKRVARSFRSPCWQPSHILIGLPAVRGSSDHQ